MQQWLRQGSTGDQVSRWQAFLRGISPRSGVIINGVFDTATLTATMAFQASQRLPADGVVGNMTLLAAVKKGYQFTQDDDAERSGPGWPRRPDGVRQMTSDEKIATFGNFKYVAAPTSTNPEGIRITDGWDKKNITYVSIPQINAITGRDLKIGIHVKVKDQFVALWNDWESEGLLDKVLTWNGAFVPRFIRGSDTSLSNHSLGTAFDINVQWNRLGATPALVDQKGSVRELVDVAVKNGWYWGGWFPNRPDGMHFEVRTT